MSILARQYLAQESVVEKVWTDDATLYQPYEAEQILIAENASCLAVKAYLNMCNLEYTTKSYPNVEFISPGGRFTKLPFIKVGAFVSAEFEPIVSLVESKGISLTTHFDEDQKFDMRAYITLAENIFTNAELYISWVDKNVLEKVTYPRYGSVYPWPLNHLQCWKKRSQVLKQLSTYDWRDMSIEDVTGKVRKCCDALSDKLENHVYFYDDKPTELDAFVFGHLFTILTTHLPNNILAETVNKYDKLVRFCKNIDQKFFTKK